MFVGNISQYDKESRFLPEYIRPWIEKLVSLAKSDLQPGRHTFDTVNYMNVDDSRADSDAWFYNPDVAADTVIAMTPGTYAVFTPADGHRCLCAPDGQGKAIKKAILKIHV